MEKKLPANGHRLDRIEAALEALVRGQSHLLEAQTALEPDHQRLLTAQVVLTETVQRHTDERMAALIAVVDGLVRNRPQP
jgi:hypothetical protein